MENEKKVLEQLKDRSEKQMYDFFSSVRKKILYGLGMQAVVVTDICIRLGYQVEAYLATDAKKKISILPSDIPAYSVNEFPFDKEEYDVLIAVNQKYNEEICKTLEENGFLHVYYSENWNRTNEVCRQATVELFLAEHDTDYTKKVLEYGDFRIRNIDGMPKDYTSMLLGEFFDIIAPSIYDCSDFLDEGAYEYENVTLEKDDVVLDLGANIGMFSCVAAAKAKKVYAFEPTPTTIKLLQQNAALYDNFEIVEYAAAEKEGECCFTINDLDTLDNVADRDIDSGRNSLYAERLNGLNMKTTQIMVKTITLDMFAEKYGVEKIDFIKADIEGAERYMLMGAKRVLKEFAPKLALRTYHLPDDKEVMTRLIMEANPDYKIVYGEKTLYAYVP